MSADVSEASEPRLRVGRVDPGDMLRRLARALREEIGPNVERSHAKTQAFMAAVILDQLAREVSPRTVAGQDGQSLPADLETVLGGGTQPVAISDALAALRIGVTDRSLTQTVRSLYECRSELGEDRFVEALARARLTMRRRLDIRLGGLS